LGTTADDNHFAIDDAIDDKSGQIKTRGALDHESDDAYTVTVTATDPGGLSSRVTVTITVTDVNEAPAYAAASIALSVAESAAAGTNLGNPVAATDEDGDALTYALGATTDDNRHRRRCNRHGPGRRYADLRLGHNCRRQLLRH
jgi:hypothetical protein